MNLMTCSISCHNMIHELQIYLPCYYFPIIPFYHITSYGASLCPGLGKFIKNKWPSLFVITPVQVTCTKYGWSHQSDRNMILCDKNVVKHVMDLSHVECTYVICVCFSLIRTKIESCRELLERPGFQSPPNAPSHLREYPFSILNTSSLCEYPMIFKLDLVRPRSSSHSAKSRWQDLKPPT